VEYSGDKRGSFCTNISENPSVLWRHDSINRNKNISARRGTTKKLFRDPIKKGKISININNATEYNILPHDMKKPMVALSKMSA
jgi:hypothetical protein